jgi:hypothetical protein
VTANQNPKTRVIGGVPPEIQRRIRYFSAAEGLNVMEFLDKYVGQIISEINRGRTEIDQIVDGMFGRSVYNFPRPQDEPWAWGIRINPPLFEAATEAARLTTGSFGSFIRDCVNHIGYRLPPSGHIIQGVHRRLERSNGKSKSAVGLDRWDGCADVAQDEADRNR